MFWKKHAEKFEAYVKIERREDGSFRHLFVFSENIKL